MYSSSWSIPLRSYNLQVIIIVKLCPGNVPPVSHAILTFVQTACLFIVKRTTSMLSEKLWTTVRANASLRWFRTKMFQNTIQTTEKLHLYAHLTFLCWSLGTVADDKQRKATKNIRNLLRNSTWPAMLGTISSRKRKSCDCHDSVPSLVGW